MEWVVSVCPTFIWELHYPLFIFILDLQSERWAAPLVCVDWREGEHWKINKRQQKEKASRIKKGRGLLWPKTLLHTSVFRCKGSEVDLSISYKELQKTTRVRQGMRWETGCKGKRIFCPNRIIRITFYNLSRWGRANQKPSRENYCKYIGWMGE